MIRKKNILTASAITAFGFSLAFGLGENSQQQHDQEAAGSQPGQEEEQQEFGAPDRDDQEQAKVEFGLDDSDNEKVHKLSKLKGASVQSQEGEDLGEIEEIAVDLESGEVSFILISADGSQDWHPVPPGALEVSGSGEDLQVELSLDQQSWEDAPTISREEVAQLDSQGQEIYGFYGEEWEGDQDRIFGAPGRDREEIETPGIREDDLEQQEDIEVQEEQEFGARNRDDQPGSSEHAPGQQPGEAREHAPGQQPGEAREHAPGQQEQEFGAGNRGEDQELDAQSEEEDQEFGGSEQEDQQEFGARVHSEDEIEVSGGEQQGSKEIKLSEDLMDSALIDQNDEEIGTISDMLVNLQDGKISFVLLETEESGELYAVSPMSLQASMDGQFQLSVTREDFENAESLSLEDAAEQAGQQQETEIAGVSESPEIYLYEDSEEETTVFGAPGRDDDEMDKKHKKDKEHKEKKEHKERDGQSPQYEESTGEQRL